jgi:hypothetical protein
MGYGSDHPQGAVPEAAVVDGFDPMGHSASARSPCGPEASLGLWLKQYHQEAVQSCPATSLAVICRGAAACSLQQAGRS